MFMTEHVMTEGMADMEERSMQGQGASCFHVTRMNADEISEAAALEREAFPDPWSEAMLCSGFAADSQTYFGWLCGGDDCPGRRRAAAYLRGSPISETGRGRYADGKNFPDGSGTEAGLYAAGGAQRESPCNQVI